MHPIDQAIKDFRAGKMIIVTDDEHRENEGDLIMAGELVTPEDINFMIKKGGGLICLAMSGEKIDALGLPFMRAERSTTDMSTAFTVSIDARYGITTGISAAERAHTARVVSASTASAADIIVPGHMMPVRARDKGVLERPGHTEAAVDIAQLAGLQPVSVICEIIGEDGSMLRGKALTEYAQQHGLTLISIQQLQAYRQTHAMLHKNNTEKHITHRVKPTATCQLQTKHGVFTLHVFRDEMTQAEHVALVHGDMTQHSNPLVRLHSSCLTGDIFGSLHCDCGEQLNTALDKIAEESCGILIYLDQEGRGVGLTNKMRAYALQEQGHDTISANLELGLPADARDYAVAAEMLQQLGVKNMRLLTNNPQKLATLSSMLHHTIERVPHQMPVRTACRAYLKAKRDQLGHLLDIKD